MPGPPPVPQWLSHRPTQQGLVVPWVAARGFDQWLLGATDPSLAAVAITERLCQVCGGPLGAQLVLLVVDLELVQRWTPTPPLHPGCAAYTELACPAVTRLHRLWLAAYQPAYGPCGRLGVGWKLADVLHIRTAAEGGCV